LIVNCPRRIGTERRERKEQEKRYLHGILFQG
jgi:hypothetical protein